MVDLLHKICIMLFSKYAHMQRLRWFRYLQYQLVRFYFKHPAMAYRKPRFKIMVSLLLASAFLVVFGLLW